MNRYRLLIGLTLCSLLLVGCGKGSGDLLPVSGTVTLDKAPLVDAAIQFIPTGETKGQGGTGITDKQGKYEILTPEGKKGLIAGDYKVIVSRLLNPDGTPAKYDPNTPPIEQNARESLPEHYSNPERTTLSASIRKDGGPIDFTLEGKGK